MMKRNLWTVLLILVLVSTSAAFARGGGGSSGGGSGSSGTTLSKFIDEVEDSSGADARAGNIFQCFSLNGAIKAGNFRAEVEARTSSFPIEARHQFV